MGLTDKFKTMAKQAQDAVAEHADKLHGAVDTVGVAVNEKTQGKYANKIAKVGEKTGSAIDKLGGVDPGASETEPDADSTASAEQPSAEQPTAEPPTAASAEQPPTASAEQPPTASAEQPPTASAGQTASAQPAAGPAKTEQAAPIAPAGQTPPAGGNEAPSFDE